MGLDRRIGNITCIFHKVITHRSKRNVPKEVKVTYNYPNNCNKFVINYCFKCRVSICALKNIKTMIWSKMELCKWAVIDISIWRKTLTYLVWDASAPQALGGLSRLHCLVKAHLCFSIRFPPLISLPILEFCSLSTCSTSWKRDTSFRLLWAQNLFTALRSLQNSP